MFGFSGLWFVILVILFGASVFGYVSWRFCCFVLTRVCMMGFLGLVFDVAFLGDILLDCAVCGLLWFVCGILGLLVCFLFVVVV